MLSTLPQRPRQPRAQPSLTTADRPSRRRISAAGVIAAAAVAVASLSVAPPAEAKVFPGRPAITGTVRAGEVLVGTYTGALNYPGAPYAVKGMWDRCVPGTGSCGGLQYIGDDGASYSAEYDDLPFPFESTYVVQPDDIGYAIVYTVLAHNDTISEISSSAQIYATGLPPRATGNARLTVSGTPRDGEIQTVRASGSYLGTPPFTTTYTWERCDAAGAGCTAIEPLRGVSRTATVADIGHTLRLTAATTNVNGAITLSSTPTAVIAAIPTENVDPPSVAGTAVDGGTLNAADGSWRGSADMTYTRTWQLCDGAGGSCQDFDEHGAALTLAASAVGSTVRVAVTATGPGGTVTTTSAPSPIVTAAAPYVTVTPAVGGTAIEGATLQADPGHWSGTGPVTFTYAWRACNESGATCTTIANATASTLQLTPAEVGKRIRVKVIATGPGGVETATSSATVAVEGRPPINLTLPRLLPPVGGAIEPAPLGSVAAAAVRAGTTLQVGADDWDGTRDMDLSVQWERGDGALLHFDAIDGAAARTYTPSESDAGSVVRARIVARNVAGASDAVTDPVLILASSSDKPLPHDQQPSTPPDVVAELLAPSPSATTAPRMAVVLGLRAPAARCVGQLRQHVAAGGALSARGTLPGRATILAGGRPVLSLVADGDALTIRSASGTLLGTAPGVGTVTFTKRSSGRIAARAQNGKVLVAIGRQHGDVVIKGRTCTYTTATTATVAARADQPRTAIAYLTTDAGEPLADATVVVVDGARRTELRTDARGRARLQLPAAAGSRSLQITYAGDDAHAPATLPIEVAVKAMTTLRGHATATTTTLTGTVLGAGGRVRLEYLDAARHWRPLGTATTATAGRWTLTAGTPRRRDGGPQLVVRAVLPQRGAFRARVGAQVRVDVVTATTPARR